MHQPETVRTCGMIAVAAALVSLATIGVSGQKPGPADVAAKLSGTWKLNRELSPSVGVPGRGRPGGPGRGGPSLAIASAAMFAPQRGGGGGMPSTTNDSDLPPDVLASQAAMRDLQQTAEVITIKATPDSIVFSDQRGDRTYTIDNKSAKHESNGARLDVKTRWDKLAVRQEFTSPQTRLIRSWEVDDDNRLILKVKVESMTLNTKEVKAVYDRQ